MRLLLVLQSVYACTSSLKHAINCARFDIKFGLFLIGLWPPCRLVYKDHDMYATVLCGSTV